MKLSKLKPKDGNPRYIKDDKFEQLVKSIREFPKMMELRPMVYDPETMEVLGGNMRLRALAELGYKDIPDNWVVSAEKLTEEEKERFIIVDNVGFGGWDFDLLANQWEQETLEGWGLDVDFNDMETVEEQEEEEFKAVITLKVTGEIGEISDLFEDLSNKGFNCEIKG